MQKLSPKSLMKWIKAIIDYHTAFGNEKTQTVVHHASILYTKLSIDNKTNIQSKVKINYMNVKTKRHPIKYSLSCNNVGMFIPLLEELTHHGH